MYQLNWVDKYWSRSRPHPQGRGSGVTSPNPWASESAEAL